MNQTPLVVYAGDVFLRTTIEQAREIILTPEVGLSTDERWQRETEWLLPRLFFPAGLLIDFGCGIGRVSRHLVARGNTVIGVDRSITMRAMAEGEVQDPAGFTAISPEMLYAMQQYGLQAEGALAIWTLQHIPASELMNHVELLHRCLVPGAVLWTMERPERYVPVEIDGMFSWMNDGISVVRLLEEAGFMLHSSLAVPEDLCAPGAALRHWIRRR